MPGRIRPCRLAARVVESAALVVALSVMTVGCAGNAPTPLADVDQIRAELPRIQAHASEQPDDAKAQLAYGLALRALGDDAAAIEPLTHALELDPSETPAALALGTLHESAGRDEAAGEVYDSARPKSRQDRRLIEAARARMERRRLSAQMRELATHESEIDVARIPESTLAVTSFEPGSGVTEMQDLGKAIAVVVATELTGLPGITLVEREKLRVLQDELGRVKGESAAGVPPGLAPVADPRGIQQRLARLIVSGTDRAYYSGPVDGKSSAALRQAVRDFQRDQGLTVDGIVGPRTATALDAAVQAAGVSAAPRASTELGDAPRAGRLLGARRLLGGRYFAQQSDAISVEARIEDTVTGEMLGEVESHRPRDAFHEITGDLVIKTAEALAIPLTPEDRRRILSLPPPTRSLSAFLAFGQAVDLEERGLLDQAAEAYGQAVRLDPQFALARQKSAMLSVGSAAFQQSIDRTLRAAIRRVGASGRATMAGALGMVGTGVEEDAPRDDQADGMKRTAQAEGAPTGQARVHGQIPVGGRP